MGKVVDMEAVREALANLRRLARENPERLAQSSPGDWEDLLNEAGLEDDDDKGDGRREAKDA